LNPSNQIAVIFGGDWGEREVSISSARAVIEWLLEAKYDPIPVLWDAGGWYIYSTPDVEDPGELSDLELSDPITVLQSLSRDNVEVVFNCLHGGAGEDGTLAAILSLFRMAHTGAGVAGGAVSACKITFRQRMRGIGLRVPTGAVVHQEVWGRHRKDVLAGVNREIHYPCIVKDPQGGSSEGVCDADDEDALIEEIDKIFINSQLALVEKMIVGREISVPCLGGRRGVLPQILQPVEIVLPPGERIFSNALKYGDHVALCPAKLDPELWHDLAREVRQMHLELQLGTASRTDLILDQGNNPVYLETNTVPGMTKDSLLPLSASKSGIAGPDLVRKMVEIAVQDHLVRHSGAASAS
jgi:D-alanine-D-alanine ligase